ncbi:hypothetical protein DW1_1800 [Proteiniborus sp. DW1]|uniref:YlbF family regulator n=1 Tax=Proteiniborus sp. DW1 TaxID=1889883 RepID=UPI00092E0FC6|nr:YlbF family regulator [Proteiniborus sp. DW1]SCG83368.1 hypothetical protein DW1_1800 [Proteiniborus sp. DW1]
MGNNVESPIKLARELGFSILNSAEYNSLKKSEEELLNNEAALNLLNSLGYIEVQNDNSIKLKLDIIEIKEMQNTVDMNIVIKQYLEAKKNYDNLLKNIYNIIEYITGETKISNSNNRCCGKCNSNCANCKK